MRDAEREGLHRQLEERLEQGTDRGRCRGVAALTLGARGLASVDEVVGRASLVHLLDYVLEDVLLQRAERAVELEVISQVDRLDRSKYGEQVGLECRLLVFVVQQADVLVKVLLRCLLVRAWSGQEAEQVKNEGEVDPDRFFSCLLVVDPTWLDDCSQVLPLLPNCFAPDRPKARVGLYTLASFAIIHIPSLRWP